MDMWQHMIGGKSKESLRIGQVASERTSHLTAIFSQPVGREEGGKGELDLNRESFRESPPSL